MMDWSLGCPRQPQERLRIAIATSGRFHVLDLARELDALGHDVAFYSLVRKERAMKFGLPERAHRWMPELIPFAAAGRFGPKPLREWAEPALHAAANLALKARLEPCDIFIGMSGLIVEAAGHARRRYRAKIVLERGSRHILSQAEILSNIPKADKVPKFAIKRELSGYKVADMVTVPSTHVETSFIEHGFPERRLFRNPYGVDLNVFRPITECAPPRKGSICFVGLWCLRKGADLLIPIIRRNPSFSLLHAGAIGDIKMPNETQFQSVGHVDQSRLRQIYSKAQVMVLPSREEGMALVLAQALGCGVPVVCTDRTGGGDLKSLIAEPDAVEIVPAGDAGALEKALFRMLARAHQFLGRDLLGERGRDNLTWRAYGLRYSKRLEELVNSG
jgi:glycosyltransferase involved in cell wall biosynthesis